MDKSMIHNVLKMCKLHLFLNFFVYKERSLLIGTKELFVLYIKTMFRFKLESPG